LRQSETIALHRYDLKLGRRVSYICHQRISIDNQIPETTPKTETSARLLALDHTTVAVLRAHLARQNAEWSATSSDEPFGYVFTNLHGRHLNPEHPYYAFQELTTAAEPTPVRLYDLRHTAASRAHKTAPTSKSSASNSATPPSS
jgi:integrase